ncbi:MAG TPA: L-histidine N(alpha)-methyltransferase [Thermoanaerobaculia bacterium]|nr:L-histidine N(alpha)-methyltransferase [Thermoanaerobaculia bacterium]
MSDAPPPPRFALHWAAATDRTFPGEIQEGLAAVRKSIPSHYFYDDLGSSLFEAICHLPEYYPTRAETELLRRHAGDIAMAAGGPVRIIELGSGSARKTRLLLDQVTGDGSKIEYVPVDIDPHMLEKSGRELLAEYPSLRVTAVCADFTQPSRALAGLPRSGRTLALFLGSTIGNFQPRPAAALLRDLKRRLEPGDTILLGADLKKAPEVLNQAYNDALGVTAAFNLNLLQRINRELGGRFDLRTFAHRAFYDPDQGRIEMHLVSLREQRVHIDSLGTAVSFTEGETIHTENSYKYDDADLARMAADAGLAIEERWTDSRKWFTDVMFRV